MRCAAAWPSLPDLDQHILVLIVEHLSLRELLQFEMARFQQRVVTHTTPSDFAFAAWRGRRLPPYLPARAVRVRFARARRSR